MLDIRKDTKILVIGYTQAAYSLFDHLTDKSDFVEISRIPLNHSYDLVFDVDSSTPMNLKGFNYTSYLQPSHDQCLGMSRTLKNLKESDEDFLLLLADIVIQLHESKAIRLTDAMMNKIKIRKMLHDELMLESDDDF